MKLSIIIPVYNAEAYLGKCLDSILTSINNCFEILLIDDGSRDKSFEICEEYSKKYNIVKTFHISNSGVSNARNFGLKLAQGDYIAFIDADDYILPNGINIMLNELEKHKADFIIFPFIKESANNKQEEYKYSLFGKMADANSNRLKRMFFHDGGSAPWSKLYNRKIIEDNNIRFDTNLKIHEDVMFCLDYLERCNTIYYSDNFFYFYRYNTQGALRKHKLEYLSNYNDVYYKWVQYLKKYGDETDLEKLRSIFLHKVLTTTGKLYKTGIKSKCIIHSLYHNQLYNEIISVKFIKLSDKLKQFLLKKQLFWLVSIKVK